MSKSKNEIRKLSKKVKNIEKIGRRIAHRNFSKSLNS